MRRSGWVLLAGDWLALALFVVLGLGTHETLGRANALERFLVNFGPLAVAWTAAGLALGAFRPAPPRAMLGRTLAAWLVAAPLALVARALLLGSPVILLVFLLVTLAVGGGSLLLWRAVYGWLGRRRR